MTKCLSMVIAKTKTASRNVAFKTFRIGESLLATHSVVLNREAPVKLSASLDDEEICFITSSLFYPLEPGYRTNVLIYCSHIFTWLLSVSMQSL